MTRHCKAFGQVLPLLLALALPEIAGAQESGQAAAPDTIQPVALAPVVVTVLRTPVAVIQAPYAVGVSDQSQVQRGRPGLGLDEALRTIPGVQVDNRFNYALGERISIRGFGARAQFGVRGIKVLVDGIPATLPDGQTSLSHVDLGFMRRAEVIRGPASSLYGNTAGGVIQLESERPPARALGQEVGVLAGSHGLLRLHSTTGGQVGAASYLVNLSRMDYDGFREHSVAQNRYLNARFGYATASTELRFLINAVDYDAQNPGSLSEALLREDRTQAFANNKRQQTGEQARATQVGATWLRRTDGVEWEATAYAGTREVDNPIPTTIVAIDRAVLGARTLLRMQSARMHWTLGAELDRQRDDRRNFRNRGGERSTLTLDQLEHVTNGGLFAQLMLSPGDRLDVQGGVRYDWFRFAAADRLVSAGNPDDSGERDMDAVSPSLGLSVRVADGFRLYGNVATSFQTPTTTELANRPSGAGGFNPELEPQTAVSLEAGSKGEHGGWMSYQLTIYRAQIENSLIPFEVPEAPGRQFFRNAGSAVHRGVEAGLSLRPLPALTLDASYTHTDARFEEYRTGDADYAGNRVPGVAPHRLELVLTAEAPAGWFATLEGRTVSRVAANDANTVFSPGYQTLDVRAGRERLRVGSLSLSPFAGVTNLLDEEYNTSLIINAFGQRYFEPGPGRALFFGASVALAR